MLRILYYFGPNGIIMNVMQLLKQKLIGMYFFRFVTFLPKSKIDDFGIISTSKLKLI